MNWINYSIFILICHMLAADIYTAANTFKGHLLKRGEKDGSTSKQPEQKQSSHGSPTTCTTNQQCTLINLPKVGYKHVWSRSPDLHGMKTTQKARTSTFKPRKDLSTLLQTPQHGIGKDHEKSDIFLRKKEKLLGNNPNKIGRKKSYEGKWKSRRDYLRFQHKQGNLTPAEKIDYKRTVRDPQDAYNKQRREKRKAEKKEKE